MTKKTIGFILIISFILIALVACESEENVQVRIGFFPNITHSQALVGKSNGAFEKAFGDDVIVSWLSFNAGPSEIEAIFANEVDIGYIGPIPAINGFAISSGDITIIAGATNGGAVFITRSDLVITDISELANKTIAVPQFGNTQHLSLLNLLSENGLKTKDKGGNVQVIPCENADIKTLMDKKDIDAALVPEPWGSRLINEIDANLFLDFDEIWLDGNYSTACVVVSNTFLKKHPDLVEKFLETHIEITEYINNNDVKNIVNDEIYNLTMKKIEDNVINDAFNRMKITYDPCSVSVMNFIDIYKNEGFISDCKNKEKLIDLTILNKILNKKNLEEIK